MSKVYDARLTRNKKVTAGNAFILLSLFAIGGILFFYEYTLEKNNQIIQKTSLLKAERTYVNFLLHQALYAEENLYISFDQFAKAYQDLAQDIHNFSNLPVFLNISNKSKEVNQSKTLLLNLIEVDKLRIQNISELVNQLKLKHPDFLPGPYNIYSNLYKEKNTELYKLAVQLEGLPVHFGGAWDITFTKLIEGIHDSAVQRKNFIELTSLILILVLISVVLSIARVFNKMFGDIATLSDNLQNLVKGYGRFVPHEFLKFLNKKNIVHVELGDQIKQEMTIFFSDIRDFTTLSEKMSPDENFKFINSYLGRMEPIIYDNHGVVDKYIGDAIKALFPKNVDDAVQCAIQMQKEIQIYNTHRKSCGYLPIKVGMGLHTGIIMLGTIGGKDRMDGTVLSTSVNLAYQVESLTKNLGASVIMTGSTFSKMKQPLQHHQYRVIGRVKINGDDRSLEMFEIIDGLSAEEYQMKLSTKSKFQICLMLYASYHLEECREKLIEIDKLFPNRDRAIKFYLQRCEYYLKRGKPEQWTGVIEFI